jgi:hypothetical protein
LKLILVFIVYDFYLIIRAEFVYYQYISSCYYWSIMTVFEENKQYVGPLWVVMLFIYRGGIPPEDFLENYTVMMESSSSNPSNNPDFFSGSGPGSGQSPDPGPDPSHKGKEKESTSLGKRKRTDEQESQSSDSSKRRRTGEQLLQPSGSPIIYAEISSDSSPEPGQPLSGDPQLNKPLMSTENHTIHELRAELSKIKERAIFKNGVQDTNEISTSVLRPTAGPSLSKFFWAKYWAVRGPLAPPYLDDVSSVNSSHVTIPPLNNPSAKPEYFDVNLLSKLNNSSNLNIGSKIIKELTPDGKSETLVREVSFTDQGKFYHTKYEPVTEASICNCCANGEGKCSHLGPNNISHGKILGVQTCMDKSDTAGATSREYRCCVCRRHIFSYVCEGCGCTYCKGCHWNRPS